MQVGTMLFCSICQQNGRHEQILIILVFIREFRQGFTERAIETFHQSVRLRIDYYIEKREKGMLKSFREFIKIKSVSYIQYILYLKFRYQFPLMSFYHLP